VIVGQKTCDLACWRTIIHWGRTDGEVFANAKMTGIVFGTVIEFIPTTNPYIAVAKDLLHNRPLAMPLLDELLHFDDMVIVGCGSLAVARVKLLAGGLQLVFPHAVS